MVNVDVETCSYCGDEVEVDKDDERYQCPNCGFEMWKEHGNPLFLFEVT